MNDIVHAELARKLVNLANKLKMPTKAKELLLPILGRTASLSHTLSAVRGPLEYS